MAVSALQKVKPIKADLVPPDGATPAGVTPDGKQLYRRTVQRPVIVPKVDEATGNRVWSKNPLNGEPLLPRNKVKEIVAVEELFYLDDQGNGNVEKVAFRWPTEAEKKAAERQEKIAAVKDRLAEALVDAGKSPEELVAMLQAPAPTPVVPASSVVPEAVVAAEPPKPAVVYPVDLGYGRWQLSNGQKIRGKKAEALEAEGRVAGEAEAAKADAAQVPEV